MRLRDDVELPEDHPGFSDGAYRARRARSPPSRRRTSRDLPSRSCPTPTSRRGVGHGVGELAVKHERLAAGPIARPPSGCSSPRPGAATTGGQRTAERADRVSGASRRGLVPRATFRRARRSDLLATQYVRHHSVPFYTPEPDVIHELIGHVCMLGSSQRSPISTARGSGVTPHASTTRSSSSRVFLVHDRVRRRVGGTGSCAAYGAGLLSSYGELDVSAKPTCTRGTSGRWARPSTTSRSTNR